MKLNCKLTIFCLLFQYLLYPTINYARQSEVTHRVMTVDEFNRFKSFVGVYEREKNYNIIIDGHGTGLKPPDENQ